MTGTSLQFENVGKQYRLGEVGTGTLSQDMRRAWAKLTGQPDPFLKLGEVNNREQAGGEFVWALRDINLEIKRGEVLGIIGRNGAGKSTLLKLLSRVTAPTTGVIRTRGRIASLLEVGTGFHPELTGRENIYLNGAILGMTKWEIRRKIDEIIEFSGCAKYIDTPVKRYSSGMQVRLGFAVAAHLEGEVLVVDEVLAVGDEAFQRKCIGRMNEVASDGKTVLFVSHNMQSVERLCTRACVLQRGQMIMDGNVTDAITKYFGTYSNDEFDETSFVDDERLRRGSGEVRFSGIAIQDPSGNAISSLVRGRPGRFVLKVRAAQRVEKLALRISVHSGLTRQQATSISEVVSDTPLAAGDETEVVVEFDSSAFRPGIYPLQLELTDTNDPATVYDLLDNATRPLSIVSDGDGRAKGLFDTTSRIQSATAKRSTELRSAGSSH